MSKSGGNGLESFYIGFSWGRLVRMSIESKPTDKPPILLRALPVGMAERIKRSPGLLNIANNMGWLFFDKLLRLGVGFLVGLWIARYLGPNQFGQFSYVIVFVGMFAALVELGLAGIVVREIVSKPDSTPQVLGSAFVLQSVGAIVAIIAILSAIFWLRPADDTTRMMVAIFSLSMVFRPADVIKYWFEAQVRSRYVVWVENGVFVLMAVVKVVLILGEASLATFVVVCLAEAMLVATGLLFLYALKGRGIRSWRPSIEQARHLIKESWPLLLAGLSVTLYMRVDVIMLQHMTGDREVGIYSAATRISEIFYFFPSVIVASVSPTLIRLYETDRAQYAKRLNQLYFVLCWLAIGLSIPLSLSSEQIVALLYGKEFIDAAPVLSLHVFASLAVFLGVASSQFLLVEKLQKISFYRTLIGLMSNVALNLLWIPELGAKGAAMATVVSYFIATYSLFFFKSTRVQAFHLLTSPFRRF